MRLNQGRGCGDREELSHEVGLHRTGCKGLRGGLPLIASFGPALTDTEARLPAEGQEASR